MSTRPVVMCIWIKHTLNPVLLQMCCTQLHKAISSVSHSDALLALDLKPQTLAPIAIRMYLTQLKKAVDPARK